MWGGGEWRQWTGAGRGNSSAVRITTSPVLQHELAVVECSNGSSTSLCVVALTAAALSSQFAKNQTIDPEYSNSSNDKGNRPRRAARGS